MGWRSGYAPDCKASRLPCEINPLPQKSYQDKPRTSGERDNGQFSGIRSIKENPGALAGASGTDFKVWLDWIDDSMRREAAARALLQAVLACDPRDRIPLLERFIEALRPGEPVAAFDSVMREASFWADWASTAELKAYALACYTHMSAADQRAFLGHVQGRQAA